MLKQQQQQPTLARFPAHVPADSKSLQYEPKAGGVEGLFKVSSWDTRVELALLSEETTDLHREILNSYWQRP